MNIRDSHEPDVADRGKADGAQDGHARPEFNEEVVPLTQHGVSPVAEPGENSSTGKLEVGTGEHHAEANNDKQLSYDQQRLKMKFGYWQSTVIIFQSTVGISWFTLHQPLLKVGIYLGALITILSGYITTYGLLLLDETAAMAERDQERPTRIKNVEELCGQIKHKLMPWVKWTMMFASLAMIFASSISNLCLMADTIEHYFQIPQWQTKLLTPTNTSLNEVSVKFNFRGDISVLDLHCRTRRNRISDLHHDNSTELPGKVYFINQFVLLAVRLTASTKVKYNLLTAWMLFFIGLLYYVSAASYLFVFPKKELDNSSFNLYKHQGFFFRNSFLIYLPNNVYTYVMNSIFSTEIIETLPYFRSRISEQDSSNISRKKIVLLRILVWFICVLLSMTTKNVITVLNISGSAFTPIVSYFGPLFIYYLYCRESGNTCISIFT